jgi:hypothetical protein
VGVGWPRRSEAFVERGNVENMGEEGAMNCAPTKDAVALRALWRSPGFFVSVALKGVRFTVGVGRMEKRGTACRAPTEQTAERREVIGCSSGGLLWRVLLGV